MLCWLHLLSLLLRQNHQWLLIRLLQVEGPGRDAIDSKVHLRLLQGNTWNLRLCQSHGSLLMVSEIASEAARQGGRALHSVLWLLLCIFRQQHLQGNGRPCRARSKQVVALNVKK